ncbi:MAG TPA: hypothetical protein VGQ24_10680 [Gemmatimonadales bacterium]|nr:hypothetical protein [Gemmatimonadales bacterium]
MASTVGRHPLGTTLRKRIFFIVIVTALLVFTVTVTLVASEEEATDSTPSAYPTRSRWRRSNTG